LKVSANVKIAVQCFVNFGGGEMPPLVARLARGVSFPSVSMELTGQSLIS